MQRGNVYIDVTNLFENNSITGIQRVVRSLVPYFVKNDYSLGRQVQFIVYDHTRMVYVVLSRRDVSKLVSSLKRFKLLSQNVLPLEAMKKGDIFFDIDSVWNNWQKRSWLYPSLKRRGVSVFVFIQDIIPLLKPDKTHPNTLRNYVSFMASALVYADALFTGSHSTENDLLCLMARLACERDVPIIVTSLGVDTPKLSRRRGLGLTYRNVMLNRELRGKRYLIFVGTLEPRKRHDIALEAFLSISKQYPELHLVFAGKLGWGRDHFVEKLHRSREENPNIHWLQDADDRMIRTLIRNSYASLYLSDYEGYGLPIAESLRQGVVTLALLNSSIGEVGGEFADYLPDATREELVNALTTYLENDDLYKARKSQIAKGFRSVSWGDVYGRIHSAIRDFDVSTHGQSEVGDSYQHVIISIRPDDAERCIMQTDKMSRCVKEYIIITSDTMVASFKQFKSKHPVRVVSEREVLQDYEQFSQLSHQAKNWMLRADICKNLDMIDDVFIMLDDDNLPLKRIGPEVFSIAGYNLAKYYTQLFNNQRYETSYDIGQHLTDEFLREHAFERLSYSVHAPQIINKNIFIEAANYFRENSAPIEVDEWSAYFNFGVSRYPFQFIKRKTTTLNWPAHPNDMRSPNLSLDYAYENYYGHLYAEDGFFSAINFSSPLGDKLSIKQKQFDQYSKHKDIVAQNKNQSSDYLLMVFEGPGQKIAIRGVPALIYGNKKGGQRLLASYLILTDTPVARYTLRIQNSAGPTAEITIGTLHTAQKNKGHYCASGLIEIPIAVTVPGKNLINFVVKRDGEELFPRAERYDSQGVYLETTDDR